MWICGAHFINGFKSNDPVSLDYVPSVFNHIKSPKKRKLTKDMERYERMAITKKKGVDNNDRMSAAQSLLEVSEVGNGSEFCEPHSASFTSTSLSMSDIEDLECNLQKFQ